MIKRFSFCYLDYQKPKHEQFEKWHIAFTKLQALEKMRGQAIFFRKRYPAEVINSIIPVQNTYLYTLD